MHAEKRLTVVRSGVLLIHKSYRKITTAISALPAFQDRNDFGRERNEETKRKHYNFEKIKSNAFRINLTVFKAKVPGRFLQTKFE